MKLTQEQINKAVELLNKAGDYGQEVISQIVMSKIVVNSIMVVFWSLLLAVICIGLKNLKKIKMKFEDYVIIFIFISMLGVCVFAGVALNGISLINWIVAPDWMAVKELLSNI